MKKQIVRKARKKQKISRKPVVSIRPAKHKRDYSTTRTAKRKESKMSDKPKPWPYQAAEARDRSAEEAQVIVNQAEEALERTNDPMILRAIGKILLSANTILRLLEGQGSKTRPR